MDIRGFKEVTTSLTYALAKLDQDTYRHSKRVQRLALTIGREMELSTDKLTVLSLGSLLHDVGKRHVPQEILQKEAALSVEDWQAVKRHPFHGWDYARQIRLSKETKEIIRHHHLWFNGQGGYPDTDIGVRPSLLTQITTVADVVDAMTHDRPYRPALSIDACFAYLQEKKGTQFAPNVVEQVLQSEKVAGIIGGQQGFGCSEANNLKNQQEMI